MVFGSQIALLNQFPTPWVNFTSKFQSLLIVPPCIIKFGWFNNKQSTVTINNQPSTNYYYNNYYHYYYNLVGSPSLVGGFKPSEKYDFVSWGDSSQLNGKS
jgi:hypothetical protein